jgi:hypothetical protein
MGFKLTPPFDKSDMYTPIFFVKEQDDVYGRTNMNGSITINDKIKDPKEIQKVIDHEKIHCQQIKDGRLAYDNDNIYHRKSGKGKWQVKKRSEKEDGSPETWWEKEAYNT